MSKRPLGKRTSHTETGRAVHTTLLYFEYQQDGLHFIAEDEAREYLAMWNAATWGDLRRSAPALHASALRQFDWWNEGRTQGFVPLPKDEDAFDISDIPGASDGDWPRFPPFSMLDWMPRRLLRRFGTTVMSVLNGPMVRLAGDDEAGIVAELEGAGYRCVRDDGLANTLYG